MSILMIKSMKLHTTGAILLCKSMVNSILYSMEKHMKYIKTVRERLLCKKILFLITLMLMLNKRRHLKVLRS